MSNAFAIEAMESRLLLSVDPALNGAEVDPAMRAAARSYGTETAQFLTKVQTWIYDTALGYQLPLIGAPFKNLKGTSLDLLQPLINKVGALVIQNEDFSLNGMNAGL